MKNLTQFRHALTIGSVWTLEHHDNTGMTIKPNKRVVIHTQSNAVAFLKEGIANNGNAHQCGSWLYFDGAGDKAAFWEFPDDNTAIKYVKAISENPQERRADGSRMIYRKAA